MRLLFLATAILAALPAGALALTTGALEIARPFGDDMVLPCDRPFPVWGKGEPGATLQVSLGGQHPSTTCAADGSWRVTLAAMKPSRTEAELTVSSRQDRLVLKHILVGEVWLFSGQSNMDFPLSSATGGKAEALTAADFPDIRLCNLTACRTDAVVYQKADLARLNERDHFTGGWTPATPDTAARISAIAWWTAKTLQSRKHIPIGVVENAVGGSGTEAWLPREVLESRSDYKPLTGPAWLDCEKIGAWARGRAKQNLGGHLDASHPFKPGFLYESGVRGWAGFPFQGVVWYQGETNAEIADDPWNERLIEDLVTGWRHGLGQKDLPFFIVQLPRIGGTDPLRAHWSEYREVQARASKRLPGVRLIPTLDLGWDSPNVHPPDKKPVAERIAGVIGGS